MKEIEIMIRFVDLDELEEVINRVNDICEKYKNLDIKVKIQID